MVTFIYNCKRCKRGRRVEYPIRTASIWTRDGRARFFRDDHGKQIPAGVWIDSCGGGKPTVYGGDPLGVCDSCGHAMTFSSLVARVQADVPCDARCTGARGHSCDCSCGGKNHGIAWAA